MTARNATRRAAAFTFVLAVACSGPTTSASADKPADTTGTSSKPTPVPASVVVRPDSTAISVGGTVQMLATVLSGSGTSNVDQSVVWTSGSPSLASVDGAGLVKGLAPGKATIMARSTAISTVFSVGRVTITP